MNSSKFNRVRATCTHREGRALERERSESLQRPGANYMTVDQRFDGLIAILFESRACAQVKAQDVSSDRKSRHQLLYIGTGTLQKDCLIEGQAVE